MFYSTVAHHDVLIFFFEGKCRTFSLILKTTFKFTQAKMSKTVFPELTLLKVTISLNKEGRYNIFFRNCMLRNVLEEILFKKVPRYFPKNKPIVHSFYNLFMEKFHTTASRIATEN